MALNMSRGWQDRQSKASSLKCEHRDLEIDQDQKITNLGVSCVALTMETLGHIKSPTQKVQIREESSGLSPEGYPWLRN